MTYVFSTQSYVDAHAHIDANVTLHPGVYIGPNVHIEADVIVGPGVLIGDAITSQPAPTYIKTGTVIGAGAIIVSGVTVNKGVVIAPGTLVTGTLPPYALVSGTPARITGYVEGPSSTHTRMWPMHDAKDAPHGESIHRCGIGDVTLHHLKRVEDIRGNLSVGEFPTDIPFIPARYFLVFDVPSEKTRGEHAHKVCKQFLVCVRGSCAVVVDDGVSRCEVCLNAPNLGLYIPPMIWGIQYKFTPDGVLLVFASDAYDPADYIRDYADFQQWVMTKP